MKRGYIKLYRSSTDNPLYFSEPFTKWQAWCDLLILANHSEKFVNVRGIPVKVERGQVLAGENYLAERWQWSRGKVRRHLQFLEKTVQQIVQQKNNVTTIISIINYDKYQGCGTANGTADGQQTDTLNNVKNNKNKKKAPPISPKGDENALALFEECWDMFGKYGTKSKALEYWRKLSDDDRQAVKARIPIYLDYLAKTGYDQKMFQGWINPTNRMWETTYENNVSHSKLRITPKTKAEKEKWAI